LAWHTSGLGDINHKEPSAAKAQPNEEEEKTFTAKNAKGAKELAETRRKLEARNPQQI